MSLSRMLTILGAVLVLGVVNFSIVGKEGIKRNGEVVYLDLAPVDPRSLMQGDYMALRFRLAEQILSSRRGEELQAREGEQRLAAVILDERRVAHLAPRDNEGHLRIRYRVRQGGIWLGTNAFFFEEGSDQRYARARYGEFRVDRDSGEAVLVGLRGANLQPL